MAIHGNSSEAYLEWHYRLVSSIFWVPLTVIGISGNLMVILVVMTVRGMKTPTNCYLVSLAMADCLFFVSSTPVELSSIHLPEDVFLFGRIGCSILRFLPFLSMNASSLSITAFTVERYIGICHPMKARYICTVKRAQLIIVIIWSCSVLYNSTWLFLTDLKPLNYTDWPNAYQCTYSLNRASYKAVFLLDLFAFYWVPLLLYLILYGSMARILIKAGFFHSSSFKFAGSTTSTAKPNYGGSGSSVQTTFGVRSRRDSLDSPVQRSPLRRGRIASLRKSQSSISTAPVRRILRTSSKMSALSLGGCQTTGGFQPSNMNCVVLSGSDALPPISRRRLNDPNAFIRASSSKSILSDDFVTDSNHTVDNLNGAVSTRAPCHQRARAYQEKRSLSRDSKAYYGEGLSKARVQVVKMLVVIVVVFALFWLPYRGLVVYNSFTKKPWIEKWYLLFAKTMVMVNCAINPILYNVMSGKFRSAFIIMFKRCFGASSSNRAQYQSEAPSMPTPTCMVRGAATHLQQREKRNRSITNPSPQLMRRSNRMSNSAISVPDDAQRKRHSPVIPIALNKLSRRASGSFLPPLISQSDTRHSDEIINDECKTRNNEQSKRHLLLDQL